MKLKISLKNKENAMKFVNSIQSLQSNFDIVIGQSAIDAKSILGILTLDLSKTYLISCDIAENEKEKAM